MNYQRFIQEKIGSENRPFTKIGDLKMDLKIKNYNVMFHICSGSNDFARKCLKNFTELHFFHRKKKLLHKNKSIFHKNKKLLHKIIRKIH